jgi:PAS domain S-box-containing protein
MDVFQTVARGVLSTRSDAIIAADTDGTIIFWNAGAERIFGHTSESALGQSLDIIIPERLRQRHWEGYRRVMQGGASRYKDGDLLSVPGVRLDGAKLFLEFTITPLRREDGQLAGLVAVLRDATDRLEQIRSLKRQLAGRDQPAPRPGASASAS